MRAAYVCFLATIVAIAFLGEPNTGFAQRAEVTPTWLAGYPLASARREAIAVQSFQRTLDAQTIRKWMNLASKNTMAEFELFLGPLSAQEQRLLEATERMPAPIVNRLQFEDLRGVLAKGGLLSLREEEKRQGVEVRHTTPGVENELFGAYDCVFASIGPPDGSPRYGDVIIRLKDRVRDHGWATPFSGMHFMWAVRHKDARQMQALLAAGKPLPPPPGPMSLGFDDRLHFSNYVVTEKEWNRALAYQAILVMRNLGDSSASERVRARLAAMLETDNPRKFWTLFIPAEKANLSAEEEAARVPFGYLEGKFSQRFSIDDFESIEVSAEQLEQVRKWPEAKPYLDIIRAKPLDSQEDLPAVHPKTNKPQDAGDGKILH